MASTLKCVYCRERPRDPRWAPFCSERCKLLDLAAWADGRYRIAGEDAPPATDVAPTRDPDEE